MGTPREEGTGLLKASRETSPTAPALSGWEQSLSPTSVALVVVAVLVVAGVAAYWPVLSAGWTNYDDPDYVTSNSHVLSGWNTESWRWSWTTFDASNWHPLTWQSHLLDVELFGVTSAEGPHAVNLAFHLASSCLLFFLFWKATGVWPTSAALALLFMLHPVHVESVAWIAQRKSVLALVLLLGSLYAYTSYARDRKMGIYFASVILYAGSLLAKPMGVVFPLLLFLWDFWPLGRWPSEMRWAKWRGPTLEKIPFVILAAVVCGMTLLAQQKAMAVEEVIPRNVRILNAVVEPISYIAHFFSPVKLAVLYPHPLVAPPAENVILSLFLLVGVTLASFLARRRWPYLIVGWLWFLASLIPVLGVIQVGAHFIADRYLYLPSIGLLCVLVWGVDELFRAWTGNRRGVWALTAVIALVMGVMTFQQSGVWRDSITLFESAVARTQRNFVAHSQLAAAYFDRGDEVRVGEHLQGAYDAGFRDPKNLVSLASIRARQGRWIEAEALAREVISRRPEFANAYAKLAEIRDAQQDRAGAQKLVAEALLRDPQDPLALQLRAKWDSRQPPSNQK